jgi:hypothetical protein
VEDLLRRVPHLETRINSLHVKLVNQVPLPTVAHMTPARALTQKVSQKILVDHIHKLTLRALRASMDNDAAALMRASSGQGSGAFLDVPLDDRWVIPNARFVIACRRRLALPFAAYDEPPNSEPVCSNTTMQGRVCGRRCDAQGKHLEVCAPGGGLMVRHDGLVRCLAQLCARSLDPKPYMEQVIPELARPVNGQVGQARLDIVVHDGISRSLVDVVVVSPFAGDRNFRAACARRDGHASRRAAIAKRARYPSADLVPFPLETGGRLGMDARSFIARMANASEHCTTEFAFLYRAISSVLQDGVARQMQVR